MKLLTNVSEYSKLSCALLTSLRFKYKSWSNAGALMEAIKKDFGSFESFKERFNTATIAVQGSGWGWLVSKSKVFHVTVNANLKFCTFISLLINQFYY